MPGNCAAHGGVVSHAWAAQDASDCTPSQPQTIARDACLERWRLCPPRLQTASTASSGPIAPALKFKPALSFGSSHRFGIALRIRGCIPRAVAAYALQEVVRQADDGCGREYRGESALRRRGGRWPGIEQSAPYARHDDSAGQDDGSVGLAAQAVSGQSFSTIFAARGAALPIGHIADAVVAL